MLDIFVTEQQSNGLKTIYNCRPVERICDDCWIKLTAPTEDELNTVADTLGVPSEFLRYPLDVEERPRIDSDDDTGHVLLIVDVPYRNREGERTIYETVPLGIILTGKQLITVSLYDAPVLDVFENNRQKDLMIGYRTRFTIQILLSVAKAYLRSLRFIDKSIDAIEAGMSKSINNSDLYKMLELSKTLVYFSTSLKSNEAVLEKLMRGRLVKQYEEDEDLLEDVIIEYKQAHEMADIYINIVNSNTDAYASIISNNLNDIMKILAAATIVLTVPNIFTSFFGQNCPFPWDADFWSDPVPFFILTGISLISTILCIVILKRKKML